MESMGDPEIVYDFYGVYLLYNINPKFKGRTYIGYTRDPNRRITQHNRGTWAGGALRTSSRGPWKMVMIVHGFPNNISALRFEWAWQNPNKTTRLQHLDLKKIPRKESEYQFKLRVVSHMLRTGPWCRLPLVVRWLEPDFRENFPLQLAPPGHMPTVQGPVRSCNDKKYKLHERADPACVPTAQCRLCRGRLGDDEKLRCVSSACELVAHVGCLADTLLPAGEYVPVTGRCPLCNVLLTWGELIARMKGYDPGTEALGGNGDGVRYRDRDSDNSAEEEDVVCTQDELLVEHDSASGRRVQRREFVDDFDNDDVVCTQDGTFGDCEGDDRGGENNEEFVVSFNDDDDVVCTQHYNDRDSNVAPRSRNTSFDDVDEDGVMCTQSTELNDCSGREHGHVARANVGTETVNVSDVSDGSDDEVLFKPHKHCDEQPSWFLDCNEHL